MQCNYACNLLLRLSTIQRRALYNTTTHATTPSTLYSVLGSTLYHQHHLRAGEQLVVDVVRSFSFASDRSDARLLEEEGA